MGFVFFKQCDTTRYTFSDETVVTKETNRKRVVSAESNIKAAKKQKKGRITEGGDAEDEVFAQKPPKDVEKPLTVQQKDRANKTIDKISSALLKLNISLTAAKAPETKDHITPIALKNAEDAVKQLNDARPKLKGIIDQGTAGKHAITDTFRETTTAIRNASKATKVLKYLIDNIDEADEGEDE